MTNTDKVKISSELSDREFDLIKLELQLQEQRILHLENLQYRLRQFSIILWVAMIGVGLRITAQGNDTFYNNNILLIGVSSIVPILFLYMDALYAIYAQHFRSRKNEIIDFFNKKNYEMPSRLTDDYIKEVSNNENSIKFPVFDFHGSVTLDNDPQTTYRSNIFVKLTRKTRIFFYGFQIFGSSIILSHLLTIQEKSFGYYFLILVYGFLIGVLYLIRYVIKLRMLKTLQPDYQRKLDERADKHYL